MARHFLLIYNLAAQRLEHTEEFSDASAAMQAYAEAERRHLDTGDVEIVLVAADSIETIRHTHGSYFRGEVAPPYSSYVRELINALPVGRGMRIAPSAPKDLAKN